MFRIRTFQPPNVAETAAKKAEEERLAKEAAKKAEEERLAKEAEEAAKKAEEPVKQTTKKNKKK